MLRDYLQLQLLSEDSGLLTVGVPLDLHGKQVVLYAKLTCLLGDGDGLRSALQWVGAAGVKPCFRHLNVLRKNSGRAEHDPNYVEITCSDPAMFRQWPEGEFRAAVDTVIEARASCEAGDIPTARLVEVERAFGLKTTREGLLASAALRPHVEFQSVMRYDWVHTFLADGVLTCEAWRLIDQMGRERIATQADLHDFLKQKWRIPRHRRHNGRTLDRIFDAYNSRANEQARALKCSASELITLYGMLRHWVETSLPLDDPRVAPYARCFFRACVAVDVLIMAKRRAIPMKEAGVALRAALSAHQIAHQALYGSDHVKPKHHWAFDVCDHLEADPWLFDSFVIERLHLRVRAVAEHCKELGKFEVSVLSGVINDHARRLSDATYAQGSMGRSLPFPGLQGAMVSDNLELAGARVAVGDFVFRGNFELGIVVACACDGGELFAIVDEWDKVAEVSLHSARWASAGRRAVWRASEVSECAAWQERPAGQMLVVRM